MLVDRDGNLLASQQGPGSYHLEIGMDGLRAVLADGLAALFGQAGIDGRAIAYAFFGIPPMAKTAWRSRCSTPCRSRCSAIAAIAAAMTWSAPGPARSAARTASTSSLELARSAMASARASLRAGGWGEVFGDEGSAYWIAVQGLNVFTRMSDGRLPKGPLHGAFRASFGLSADLDLCAKVLNEARGSIAAMSQLVVRAAQDGDPSAVRIFDDAARELAAVVEAVHRALEFAPGEGVPVSYSAVSSMPGR